MSDNSQATATSSMVSSSNFSHSMEAGSPAEASDWISFKGPSPPDASQKSARIPQFVAKQNRQQQNAQLNPQLLHAKLQNQQIQSSKLHSSGPRNLLNQNLHNHTQIHDAHLQNPISQIHNPEPQSLQHILPNQQLPSSIIAGQGQWLNHILDQNSSKHAQGDRKKSMDGGGTSSMRSMWEHRIQTENVQKQHEDMVNATLHARRQFLFPKWRSVDPLTASLVASHSTTKMIPGDSRIPAHRQEMLMDTERMAPNDKLELHRPYINMAVARQLHKAARRLFVRVPPQNPEALANARAMELLHAPKPSWYDPAEIRDQVSHESIADVNATRRMFERGEPWDHGTFREVQLHHFVPRPRSQQPRGTDQELHQDGQAHYICRSVHKF